MQKVIITLVANIDDTLLICDSNLAQRNQAVLKRFVIPKHISDWFKTIIRDAGDIFLNFFNDL